MSWFYQVAPRFQTLTNWELLSPRLKYNANLCFRIGAFWYRRLALFSDNIGCCCYQHPKCIVWHALYVANAAFDSPMFCAPLFHVIKQTIRTNTIYTHTNTKKTIHAFDISGYFVNRSTFPCPKWHNLTIFPGRNNTIRLHWQLKLNEKRTGLSPGHSWNLTQQSAWQISIFFKIAWPLGWY